MNRWVPRLGSVAVAAVLLCAEDPSFADWPMGRQNAQRTGAAPGESDIRQPEEIWRYYLGGSLSADGLAIIDVNGDGVDDYVMVAGGALVAKTVDDTVLWRVGARGLIGIVGVTDLDGDAILDVIAAASAGVTVVDSRTGSVTWELPAGLMKQYGGVRVGDLDHDGLDDLAIVESGPCAAAPGDWPGAVYAFRDGARQLWSMPTIVCSKGSGLTLFDADGDGTLEVLEPTYSALQLLDGPTGSVRSTTPPLGASMAHLECMPVEVDGTPGEEVACLHSNPFFYSERSVLLVDHDSSGLRVVWRRHLSSNTTGELRALDLAVDLGAGMSIVVSARDAPDQPWTTFVLDGRTGEERAVLPEELVAGTSPRPAGGRYLLTSSNTALTGWRATNDGVERAWTRVGDEQPVRVFVRTAGQRAALATRAATLPGAGRLLVSPRSAPGTIRAVDLFDGGSTVVAEVQLPPGIRADSSFLTGGDDVAFAMSRSDGFLAPYDELLVLQVGIDLMRLPRTGGHVATGTFRALGGPPRTADLDHDRRDEVIVVDSRSALVRLDPEDAALHAPPRPTWTVLETLFPAVTADADGEPAIACVQRDLSSPGNPIYALTVRSANADLFWSSPLGGPPLSDVIPGDLDGDDVPDLVAQWGLATDLVLHTAVHAGTDGTQLWEQAFDPGSGRAPAGASVSRWPGESNEVVIHVGGRRVWVLAGGTGSVVVPSPDIDLYYSLPSVVQLDADVGPEIVLTGGGNGITVLDDDLSTTFASSDTMRPFPYGSIARCPDDAVVLASESLLAPSRLLLTTIASGSSGLPVGTERTLWLSGGVAHADETEAATAGFLGQLTSSTVHENLTGASRPSVLVGSGDGWLYALDPCAATLDFTHYIGAAVGEAVYGDGDGDGKDEILVTAGDGYLRALQQHTIESPAWVIDVDPSSVGTEDIDEISPRRTLGARWASVAGAERYQVAVITRDGEHLLTPPWQDVLTTEVSFPDLSTVEDRTFFVLVRSVGSGDRSVDRRSDGVTVIVTVEPPEEGPPDGCCAAAPSRRSKATTAVSLALIVGYLTARRRRRASAR
ncbi:MAG: hypothetical protein K8M05_10735 [Deltaproteobacteria bacterium]|nr:hypothetical protein [Kofleriaceae bacterium]